MKAYKLPFIGASKLKLFGDIHLHRGEYIILNANELSFRVLYTHSVRIADPGGLKVITLNRKELDKVIGLIKNGDLVNIEYRNAR
jgi:hypothetical protein